MGARRIQGEPLSSVPSRTALPPIFKNLAPRAPVTGLETAAVRAKGLCVLVQDRLETFSSRRSQSRHHSPRSSSLLVGAFPSRGGTARMGMETCRDLYIIAINEQA